MDAGVDVGGIDVDEDEEEEEEDEDLVPIRDSFKTLFYFVYITR